jgi:hypothetical protein
MPTGRQEGGKVNDERNDTRRWPAKVWLLWLSGIKEGQRAATSCDELRRAATSCDELQRGAVVVYRTYSTRVLCTRGVALMIQLKLVCEPGSRGGFTSYARCLDTNGADKVTSIQNTVFLLFLHSGSTLFCTPCINKATIGR